MTAAPSAAPIGALDVGGTSIKGALVAPDGTTSGRFARLTRADRGPDAVIESVLDAAAELTAAGASALGIVVPGVVSDGIAHFAANLGWHEVPLQQLAIERLGVPVVLEHDVRAAGLAESTAGGEDDLLLVVLGTGIANVTIVGGQPLRGARGLAGEIGHVPVRPDGEVCVCGQLGCLEVYASASGIMRRYVAAGGTAPDTAALVAATDTDPIAARIWTDATDALGLALTSATMLLDPARIVLAGGVAAAGDRLIEPTIAALHRLLLWRPVPPLSISPLGADAGLQGAALFARRLLTGVNATGPTTTTVTP